MVVTLAVLIIILLLLKRSIKSSKKYNILRSLLGIQLELIVDYFEGNKRGLCELVRLYPNSKLVKSFLELNCDTSSNRWWFIRPSDSSRTGEDFHKPRIEFITYLINNYDEIFKKTYSKLK